MTVAALVEKRDAPGAPVSGLVDFPDGLLGFPHTKRYHLVTGPGDGLYWLVGLESDEPTFLLSDPFTFFPGYAVELSAEQKARIDAHDASSVAVFAITVPGRDGVPWTANTQGPIVINVDSGRGAQLVLTNDPDGLRRPFVPQLLRAAG